MTHNDQCSCTECTQKRAQQPPAPPVFVGSGGVQVEVLEREVAWPQFAAAINASDPRIAEMSSVEVRELVEMPALAAGATVVGAAVIEPDKHAGGVAGPGRTVAILARVNGALVAIWYDREINELVSRHVRNVQR